MTGLIRVQAAGAREAGEHVSRLVEKLREETDKLQLFEREAVEV